MVFAYNDLNVPSPSLFHEWLALELSMKDLAVRCVGGTVGNKVCALECNGVKQGSLQYAATTLGLELFQASRFSEAN